MNFSHYGFCVAKEVKDLLLKALLSILNITLEWAWFRILNWICILASHFSILCLMCLLTNNLPSFIHFISDWVIDNKSLISTEGVDLCAVHKTVLRSLLAYGLVISLFLQEVNPAIWFLIHYFHIFRNLILQIFMT